MSLFIQFPAEITKINMLVVIFRKRYTFCPDSLQKKHYIIFFIRYKKNLVKPGKPGISQIKIIQCQVFSPKNLVKPGVEKICTKNLVKPGKPGTLHFSKVRYQVLSPGWKISPFLIGVREEKLGEGGEKLG